MRTFIYLRNHDFKMKFFRDILHLYLFWLWVKNQNFQLKKLHECPPQILLSVNDLVAKHGKEYLADMLLNKLTQLVAKEKDTKLRRTFQSTFLNFNAIAEMIDAEMHLSEPFHSSQCSLGILATSPTFQTAPLPLSLLFSQLNGAIF